MCSSDLVSRRLPGGWVPSLAQVPEGRVFCPPPFPARENRTAALPSTSARGTSAAAAEAATSASGTSAGAAAPTSASGTPAAAAATSASGTSAAAAATTAASWASARLKAGALPAHPASAASAAALPAGGAGAAGLRLREAILDIETWSADSADAFHIDATVRHAPSVRYQPQSAQDDGHALQVAEAEKAARYPPTAGLRCVCAAAETFGRLGGALESLLEDLAARAARRRLARPAAYCLDAPLAHAPLGGRRPGCGAHPCGGGQRPGR